MVVSIYEKFSNLLNSAAPDIYNEHVQQLENNDFVSILEFLVSNINDQIIGSDGQDITNISNLLKCRGFDKVRPDIEKISIDSENLEQIQSLIKKSPQDFVDSFNVKNDRNNAYALLLIANLVDNETMDLVLTEILNQNLQSYFLDSDLDQFFSYTLQNYLDRKALGVSHAIVSEEISKSRERVRSSERSLVKLSPLEELMQRIKANKVSELELNNALSSMPALTLKIATRFDEFSPVVKENLAKNILPKLENTPINNFCREIIEAKMPRLISDVSTDKSQTKQKTKVSKADMELKLSKFLKDEVSIGRITKEESKEIEISVKDSFPKSTPDANKLKAAVEKEIQKEDSSLNKIKVSSHSDEKVSAPDKAIKSEVVNIGAALAKE